MAALEVVIPYSPRLVQKTVHANLTRHRFSVIVAHRRMGKALDVDTPIAMADGSWKTMGTVCDGDVVFDENGNPTTVIKAHGVMLNRDCYEVVFNEGSSVVCDGDHLWSTQTKLDRAYRINRSKIGTKEEKLGVMSPRPATPKTTKEILSTLVYAKEKNHSIPTCKPVKYEKRNLLIPPYILGVWLGDGTKRGPHVTTMDSEVVDALKKYADKIGGVFKPINSQNAGKATTYTITPGFTWRLKAINVICNKHIPTDYLHSCVEDRKELFTALMDSDGYCNSGGSCCELTFKEGALADTTQELLAGLGIKYSRKIKTVNGRNYIRFIFKPDFNPFTVKHKKDRYTECARRDSQTRYIVDVRPVKSRPVRCITVDSPSSLYLCGKDMIPTHNTVCVINELVKRALLNKTDNARYAYVAPFFSQAKDIAWTMLGYYTKTIPNVKRNVSELWIEFPNGARITLYGSDNPDRMRGIGLDGCVIDEVAQCKPELWGEVVRPALMDKKGFCVFIGTPKGIDKFYELYHEACKSDDWYAASFPVTETGVIPEDELVLARKTMTENEFRREMLCDFTASVDDLFIPISLIDEATERELRDDAWKFSPLVISVDVARFGDDKSVIMVRQGLKIREIERFGDLDLMSLADHVAKYIQNFHPDAVFVDVVGLGAGLVDRLRSLGYDIIEVSGASSPTDKRYYNKRAECWGNMKEWLKYGSIPRDSGLRVDLASPKYTVKLDKILIESKEDMKKRGLKSPDAADSLAISFGVALAGVSQVYDRQDASTYEFSIQRHHDVVNPYTGY